MTTTRTPGGRRSARPTATTAAATAAVRRRQELRIGLAVALGAVAVFALVSGWLIPRGPLTTAQALASMVAAVGVGVLAGAALGSRWSLLVAPAVFVAVFEVTRAGAVGPTVDGLQPGPLVAMLPFLLGRGVHGLLAVVPMVLGGLYGIGLAARLGRRSPGLAVPGWVVTGLLTLAVVALGVVVARPASTAPVSGPGGAPLPGSIAELTRARIGGHEQALLLRGTSTDNPVLLHLAGGPGGTDIGAMRLDSGLEQHFVVASWDQRGTGKSYPAFDPPADLTLERVVADTVEVTNYLRARFDQDRIYLTGQSWGTVPAVLAARRHPELYHAFVGTGQMVSIRETDRMFYYDTLGWARRTGDTGLAARLRAMGPPPYDDVLRTYPAIVGAERELYPYPEFDGRTEMPATVWVPEYTFMDRVNAFRGLADTYAVLYPQLQTFDFRADVPRLEIPVYLVMGRHEARGRVEPAREWFDALDAPVKEWVVFEGSSHRASFERPGDYTRLLARVLADTRAAAR